MAQYLGVDFPGSIYSGNWLRRECENTAADYHLVTEVPALTEDVSFLLAASGDSDNWTLDQIETALWQAESVLEQLRTQAYQYKEWLRQMYASGDFGFLNFGTEDTCNQKKSTIYAQFLAAKSIHIIITDCQILLNNRLADIQALQEDEITEEETEARLNNLINRNNEMMLRNKADLAKVQMLEFINNLQTVLIPLLVASVGVALYQKR